VVVGENVLHHVKREGEMSGGQYVRGRKCPRESVRIPASYDGRRPVRCRCGRVRFFDNMDSPAG